jgi:hypothetical protein
VPGPPVEAMIAPSILEKVGCCDAWGFGHQAGPKEQLRKAFLVRTPTARQSAVCQLPCVIHRTRRGASKQGARVVGSTTSDVLSDASVRM